MKNILRKSNFGFKKWCVALTAAGWIGAAQAAVLVDHNFSSFNTGDLVGQQGWTQIGSAASPNLTISGGVVNLNASGQDAGVAFTSANSGSLYLGFKMRVTSSTTGGDYFGSFNTSANGTTYTGRIFIKRGATTSKFVFGLQIGATGATPVYGTTELDINTDYVIISKYNFVAGSANDTGVLYVNPVNLTTEGSNTPYVNTVTWSGTSTENSALAAASIRQGGASTGAAGTIARLLVSNDWASVAALAAPASGPSINTTGTLNSFTTTEGTASAAQTFTVTGANLSANVTVTAPTGFEVASDGATFGNTATINQSGGSASGTVSVRVAASASAGAISGNVTLASTTASGSVAVSGFVSGPVALPYGPEGFDVSQGQWLSYSSSSTKNWSRVLLGTDYVMQINGFDNTAGAPTANDWLILGPINVPSGISSLVANFNIQKVFTSGADSEFNLKVSSNYSGSGDPTSATWDTVNFTKPVAQASSSTTMDASGNVVLPSSLHGQSAVYVAFHLEATGATSTCRWSIDDFALTTTTKPPLSLTGVPATIDEGVPTTDATISIPAALSSDLVITLTSSDASELLVYTEANSGAVSAEVTIPAGETLAGFKIETVADGQVDADQIVTLTATADDESHQATTASVTVRNTDYPAPTIVINKVINNGSTDVVELLVVGNGAVGSTANLQGMILKDYSSNAGSDGGGSFTFTNDVIWSAVKSGTLIVLTNQASGAEDLDGADFVIRANLKNPTLFTEAGSMDIGGTDLVQIKAAGSAVPGSVGAIHSMGFGSSTAAQIVLAPNPKLVLGSSTSGLAAFVASNANSVLADFSGTGVTGLAAAPSTGVANNTANGSYIATLRGVLEILISVAPASAIVNENAAEQAGAINVALSSAAVSDVTVSLSASPAGAVTLHSSVLISAGSSSATVSFTPVDDGVVAGNRMVTISGEASGFTPGSNTLTVVDVQFASPSVVINEVVNSTADSVELLVVQNNLNLVGMIVKDFSGNMSGDGGGKFTFADALLWRAVKAGTLVVLTNDASATEDFDATDSVITVKLSNTTYFTSSGGMDISATDFVMIKAAGSGTAGVAEAIHSVATGTPGANFLLAGGAKLLGSGTIVAANNANSILADFSGADVVASATASLGLANSPSNETYINALRASAGPTAPSNLSYTPSTISGTVGTAISSLTPTVTGTVDTYSVSPSLPAGLSINSTSGVISGTPSAVAASATYTVTAENAAGSTTTTVSVTVNSADTPQEQYLASYGLVKGTPEAAGTADPDGDGLNNAGEFAFGTSPASGASRAVTQESVVGGIKIKWLQRSGISYTVKSTVNLGSAFSGPVSSTPVSPQPSGLGDYQQYEATLTGGDRGFIKVEAIVP